MARDLADQGDLDALWRIREDEDRLAAERAERLIAAVRSENEMADAGS